MSNDSTAVGIMNVARALSQEMQPTKADRRIQAGIDATMREVVRYDARHNPDALSPPVNVRPVGAEPVVTAGSRNGWADEVPLRLPPGQDVIERLVNATLPHGKDSKAG
jgi:hypothetical protein